MSPQEAPLQDILIFKRTRLRDTMLSLAPEVDEIWEEDTPDQRDVEMGIKVADTLITQNVSKEITHLQLDVTVRLTATFGRVMATARVEFQGAGLFDVEDGSDELDAFVNGPVISFALPYLREIIYSLTDRALPGGIMLPLIERENLGVKLPRIRKAPPDAEASPAPDGAE